MKSGSGSFRVSSIQSIIKCVKAKGISVLAYEPTMADEEFFRARGYAQPGEVQAEGGGDRANRWSGELSDVEEKACMPD